MKRYIVSGIVLALFAIIIFSCRHKPPAPVPATAESNYPPEVAAILVSRCTLSACHNAQDAIGAGSLNIDSWEHLLDGGASGAAIIPGQPQYSPLLYFVNTDPTLGPVAQPTMPSSTNARPMASLSKQEYMVLYNWIANGAPDKNGNLPFASNPDTRQKIYMTQQGCDLLAVIDAERKVVMKYIEVGSHQHGDHIESPHCVRVSNDGMYAYVAFAGGNYVQKIDTRTDMIVSEANVGDAPGSSSGSWGVVSVLPGDTALLASDWVSSGLIATINATDMQVGAVYRGIFSFPHGIESNATADTFFITGQYGNTIYKIAPATFYSKNISIDGNHAHATGNDSNDHTSPNPHEILMTPDRSKYFVTCQTTNEVRVVDAHTDKVLATIPVGAYPQDMAMSKTMPYLFVTCQNDHNNPDTSKLGSVYVIDYNSNQVVGQPLYGDFYEPHGVTVDDKNGVIYIASTNYGFGGIPPHHVSVCGGNNGWYSLYSLSTLKPLNTRRYEVSVYPYSAAVRFK